MCFITNLYKCDCRLTKRVGPGMRNDALLHHLHTRGYNRHYRICIH